jgi:hypothetical protein
VIDSQIVFNIEKLINTICKTIKITHLNKCTGTYPHNMCTEKFNESHKHIKYIIYSINLKTAVIYL